ncbi:UDP-N-acetylmuramate--L-alanine ligase [Candidatus Parcubacteria bacterium]|nr:UDP-N-acetylmuramate--L-alanine ligase [Candidatus Parcubacteria bacterium]
MNLKNIKNIYIIGIKGAGVTILAQYFRAQNINVLGSDIEDVFMTDEVLKRCGCKVLLGFKKENIPSDVDLIVYSTAYNIQNNEELAYALSSKKKVISYPEAMGSIFKDYFGIAVAGTHGKTTTSAWLGFVLNKAGLDPNVMVGANVPQFKGNALIGKSDYLILETDEYQNKFKYYLPKAVLLNNIEYDHPDFFKSEDEYRRVFIEFIKKIPKKGFLIANFDDPVIRKTAHVNCRARVISYAINEVADYVAYNIKSEAGKQYFKVHLTPSPSPSQEEGSEETNELGDFVIQLMGKHNVSNALAVIAAAIELNVPLNEIRVHLEDFIGTARRMQTMGEYRGAVLIDDYAHHPTEIKATLAATREKYPGKNIIAVFQPHTFTRTKALLKDFATSFDNADELIILDIYGSAREEHGGIHSKDIIKLIQNSTEYIPTIDETTDYLKTKIRRDDVVVFMGAGDVFEIGNNLLK